MGFGKDQELFMVGNRAPGEILWLDTRSIYPLTALRFLASPESFGQAVDYEEILKHAYNQPDGRYLMDAGLIGPLLNRARKLLEGNVEDLRLYSVKNYSQAVLCRSLDEERLVITADRIRLAQDLAVDSEIQPFLQSCCQMEVDNARSLLWPLFTQEQLKILFELGREYPDKISGPDLARKIYQRPRMTSEEYYTFFSGKLWVNCCRLRERVNQVFDQPEFVIPVNEYRLAPVNKFRN